MTIAKLDERGLLDAGLTRETVTALRHVLRQVGAKTGAPTLPEVAEETDLLNPAVAALQLANAALTKQLAILEVEQAAPPPSTRAMQRQIEELQAELQECRITNSALSKRIDDLENRVN